MTNSMTIEELLCERSSLRYENMMCAVAISSHTILYSKVVELILLFNLA